MNSLDREKLLQYPFHVRKHSWDEMGPNTHLYDNIFDVTVGHFVTIAFVPQFGPVKPSCFTSLPEDSDAIDTAEDASAHARLLSLYSVSPTEGQLGTQVIPIPDRFKPEPTSLCHTIYLVNTDNFHTYLQSLDRISSSNSSLHSAQKLEHYKNEPSVLYLIETLLEYKRDCDSESAVWSLAYNGNMK